MKNDIFSSFLKGNKGTNLISYFCANSRNFGISFPRQI